MVKIYSKLLKDIYTIHSHGNNIIQKKDMDNVIKLECLLYYNYFNKITGKVKNLQGLLQNLHKIGMNFQKSIMN